MKGLLLFVCLAGAPAAALAQASVAGTVIDPSGAPLAGVAVEASSPALIERARQAVTDDRGLYRIEDLRPGTYTVTFVLAGWRSAVRTGVELTGSVTATVDAQLTAGSFDEAVTVVGALPTVDVHSPNRETTLGQKVVTAIPTVRSYNALLVVVPGVVTSVADTVTGTAATMFPIHGGRVNEGRLMVDGLTVGSPPSGNSATSYVIDVGTAHEVSFSAGAASGEVETAGLVMNVVPQSGGNTTAGSIYASGTGKKLQADNVTMMLRDVGVMAATPLTRVYDVSGTVGGPIRKDRLWYFFTAHTGASTREISGIYYNLNAGDASKWVYAARLSSSRVFGQDVRERERPRHLADDAAKQAGDVLGRPDAVPHVHRRDAGSGGAAAGFAGSRGRARPAAPRDPGVVFRGPDEQPAARGEFRRHVLRRRKFRTRAESHARSRPRRRAVRQRLPRERQHSGTGLPIAGLQRGRHRLVPLEGLAFARLRRAQPANRVSAHADDRRSHVDDQQSERQLPRQQRRAEPADAVDLALGERRACGLGRRVRAGPMDPRPRDAAGRRTVRLRAELVSAAAGRAVALSAGSDRHPRDSWRRQLQGHHAEDGSRD